MDVFHNQEMTDLEKFLFHCSEDQTTRAIAAAMYVLTHWQLGGTRLTPRVPSMLLVNGGTEPDPIDQCAREWAATLGCNMNPSKSGSGPLFFGDYANARHLLLQTIDIRALSIDQHSDNIDHHRALFEELKATLFGYGHAGYYAGAWDEELGWMTDTSRELILRLDRPEDHAAFRLDLLKRPVRLVSPQGAGKAVRNLPKILSISGSLMAAQWDTTLAQAVVELGLPILFLPHLAKEPLKSGEPHEMVIQAIQYFNRRKSFEPVMPAPRIPEDPDLTRYEALLRKRLRNLPAAYEFSVLTMAHELGEVCARIVIAMKPGKGMTLRGAIYMHLHIMAFRGIVIGIHGLAYHGLGIDAGCAHADVVKLLNHLRTHGPMSSRDLLRRFQKFDAATRDKLLGVLEAEGVIRYDEKKITAVPLPAFIQALHDREEFAEPNFLRSGASSGHAT